MECCCCPTEQIFTATFDRIEMFPSNFHISMKFKIFVGMHKYPRANKFNSQYLAFIQKLPDI